MKVGHQLGFGLVAIVVGFMSTPLYAQDKAPCPAGLICASDPQTLISAMKRIAPAAAMTLDANGVTHFTVTDASYRYGIYLNDCADRKYCASIDFVLDLVKADFVTPDYVNEFNRRNRLVRAYVQTDGSMRIDYAISTIGGITEANLKDVKIWWEAQIARYGAYYQEKIGKK